MERVAEFAGKKVQDAVDEGLKTLGISLDDADIKIISNGGLFKKAKVEIRYDDGLKEGEQPAVKKETVSEKPAEKNDKTKDTDNNKNDEPRWGSAPIKREPTTTKNFGKPKKDEKPAVTQVKENKENVSQDEKTEEKETKAKKTREAVLPTYEQIAAAKNFLGELLKKMNIDGSVEVAVSDGMRVNLQTEDARVIGHRGEVLDAMQQLISSIINTSHGKFVHVTVDGLGYRDRRKETLENLARRMADKAVRTHRKVTLDAMNSADRRIVHAALGEREDVFTRSEGHEPSRRVAILPKRK